MNQGDAPDGRRSGYLHGTERGEQARLEVQAQLLGAAGFLPPLQPGLRLLDVGCGTGAITRAVALQVAPGEVVGLDREAAQLETARRLATVQGIHNLQFVQGDASQLQWPDESFDAVYCRFVLEHVADLQAVIAEMRRVVRPGGWVCAYEWEPGCFVCYPGSAAIEQVWQCIYQLQQRLGGDPWVGRKLYGLFVQAGLQAVAAEGRVWSLTAHEREPLRQYVTGAKEIIRQSTQPLLADGVLTPATLNQVEEAYQHLLDSPLAFVMHGFCRALGTKAG